MVKDEWAIVLDYLPRGHPMQPRSHPVAQIIGTENFNLLEVIPRDGKTLKSMDKVYIGEGKREQIKSIVGKIPLNKLTTTARFNFLSTVNKILMSNETKFISILNNMEPISLRSHSLDYLGLSHNQREKFITERNISKYRNFKDIVFRAKIDIVPYIIKHLLLEINQESKYYFFTSPKRELKTSKGTKASKKGTEPYKRGKNIYSGWKNLPRGWWGKPK